MNKTRYLQNAKHRFEKHHLEKNAFNHRKSAFQRISRRSSDNSKFQRKRLPVGIGSFVPYSRRSKGFFKPIKKNEFFEKFTVIYPLNLPLELINLLACVYIISMYGNSPLIVLLICRSSFNLRQCNQYQNNINTISTISKTLSV